MTEESNHTPGEDSLELASTTADFVETQDNGRMPLEVRAPETEMKNGSPGKNVQQLPWREKRSTTKAPSDEALASYNKHGMKFIARLANIEAAEYGDRNVYMLHFVLDFMNPFASQNRIRGAKFIVKLIPTGEGTGPSLLFVRPVADLLEVSEIEDSIANHFTVGVSANSAPAGTSLNLERIYGRTTRFKGTRLIQGMVRDNTTACWKIFEEKGSKSGLPQQVKLIALVRSEAAFAIEADLEVKANDILRFFWHYNRFRADFKSVKPVEKLENIFLRVRREKTTPSLRLCRKDTQRCQRDSEIY